MKNNTFLLLFFVFLANIATAQEGDTTLFDLKTKKYHSEFSTRIGLNSLNEINLHYEYFREGKPNILASVGMNYGSGLFTDGVFCFIGFFQEVYKKKGFFLRSGINYAEKEDVVGKRVMAVYSFGKADDITIDSGCSSGSNDADYERYDFEYHSVGIVHYWDIFDKMKIINFYLGGGIFAQYGIKRNHEKGSYYYHPPTGVVAKEMGIRLSIDLGMKINFLRLKRKK